ncbi:hypothetical protein [Bacteroides sp. UBA939]|uniref:hypothetical protein n=1 Tax=Bacteroides sp. UBA939 TaxID=1946092 RepID=UPI0025BA3B08|nr:hypothetical protein [Bacteroides sp. UBA939]
MNRIVDTVIFFAILAGFAGCSEETMQEVPPPAIPEGYIRVALDLQVEGHELVQTRADDTVEQAYDKSNVWVLLFKATNDSDSTPTELLQAPVKATQSGNTLYALLRATTQPVTLYVVTGLSTALNTAMVTEFPEGTDFADVNSRLVTAEVPSTGVPIGGISYFHMSSDPVFYSSGTTLITSITQPLIRNVARIDVDASAISITDFELEGVTLANGAKEGYVLRQAAIPAAYDGDILQYQEMASIDGNRLVSQIYLYENAGLRSDGTTPNPTMLIVRGKYKDATGSVVSGYYRMDIVKRNDDGTYTPYSIERNHCYTLTITKIETCGYRSVNEAIANKPSNTESQVIVTDANSYNVVSNGHYYLGVTNTAFISYGAATSQTITTIASNAPSGNYTNYGIPDILDGSSFTVPTTKVDFNADLSGAAVNYTGVATVRAGNLVQYITIQKKAAVSHSSTGVIEDFSTDDYVVGRVVGTTSGGRVRIAVKPGDFNSANEAIASSLVSPNGGFYIYYNSSSLASGALVGEVLLAKANNADRVKIALYVE